MNNNLYKKKYIKYKNKYLSLLENFNGGGKDSKTNEKTVKSSSGTIRKLEKKSINLPIENRAKIYSYTYTPYEIYTKIISGEIIIPEDSISIIIYHYIIAVQKLIIDNNFTFDIFNYFFTDALSKIENNGDLFSLKRIIVTEQAYEAFEPLHNVIKYSSNSLIELQLIFNEHNDHEPYDNSIFLLNFSELPNLQNLVIINNNNQGVNIESIINLENLTSLTLYYYGYHDIAINLIKIFLNNQFLRTVILPDIFSYSFNQYLITFLRILNPECDIKPLNGFNFPTTWRTPRGDDNPMNKSYDEQPFILLTSDDIPVPGQFEKYNSSKQEYNDDYNTIYD